MPHAARVILLDAASAWHDNERTLFRARLLPLEVGT